MAQDGFEYCHYVFSTRNRLPVFGNSEIETRLHELIIEVCLEKGFEIDVFEIVDEHVHLLMRRKLSDQHPYIMKSIKGITSRRIFEFEPSLKLDIGANHLWSRGYWVERVPPERLEAVRHYIRNQKRARYGDENSAGATAAAKFGRGGPRR